MPAKLVVMSGTAKDTEMQIQDEVLRIGNDDKLCQIYVPHPGLPPHAATIAYLGHGYVLYNKSDGIMELAGKKLGPQESAAWPAGDELRLRSGLTIRLDIEGDPAPVKVAAPTYTIEYDEDEPEEESPEAAAQARKAQTAKILQFIVIIAAVPLCVWMLMKPDGEKSAPATNQHKFEEIIKKLGESKNDKSRGAHSYRNILQRARAAELRYDLKEARKAYGSIRDTFILQRQRRRDPEKETETDEDKMVWDYAKNRLRVLYVVADPD